MPTLPIQSLDKAIKAIDDRLKKLEDLLKITQGNNKDIKERQRSEISVKQGHDKK